MAKSKLSKTKLSKKGFHVSFAEIMAIFASDGLVLVLPNDLKSRAEKSTKAKVLSDFCHIYFVLRRPGMKFVPGTINQGEAVCGKMSLTRNGYEEVVDFTVPRSGPRLHWTVSEFPHRLIDSGTVPQLYKDSLPAYVVPSLGRVSHPSAHEAEVLYIGQSFGDGDRTVLDRLMDHSTLQNILSEANYNSPDQDILLLLVEYAPPKLLLMIPPESTYPKDYKVDDAEAQRVIDQRMDQISRAASIPSSKVISLKNQISIIEAALINYFKPPYNVKFVHRKPQPSHQHLLECYNEDFSALTIEINTEDAGFALYSGSRASGVHHMAQFDLHDPKKRKSFFRLTAFDSDVGLTQSGPVIPIQSLKSGRFGVLGFVW